MVTTRQQNGHANGNTLYNQEVHTVHISDAERKDAIASNALLAEAITYLHRDGIIVLENAIDPSHLDELSALLSPEAEEVARDPNHHFNFGKETRNMDQAPPLIPDLMFKDVWANPIACAILQNILGPQLVCHYANGNTALGPATGRQPVHSDIDKPHPMFPFAYILNIALDDVFPENGATEIWVGSHRESCIDQHSSWGDKHSEAGLTIDPVLIEERRKHSPPVNPSTKKGSIVIRDVRLWHAGVPNRTDRPRIMLAFVIQPKWFEAPSKVLMPLKVKDLVKQWKEETGLEYNTQWADGEVDHRKIRSTDVDFATHNQTLLGLEELMHPPAV
jgi:ectoine hydroxylase-related dioxygenase (phytanoyl-CoA dioxygenase family)